MRFFAAAALALVGSVSGHTIISSPPPRENSVHTNGGGNPPPFECGSQTAIAATSTYTRGQKVALRWGRNNHSGGFVQVSVLPLTQVKGTTKDQVTAFDKPENIVAVRCYSRGCMPCNGCADKFGLGGDGTDFQQNMCNKDGSGDVTIPNWLTDGEYVMKTVIFGNGDSFGVRNMPHTSYSNCHNFKVAGGQPVDASSRKIDWNLKDSHIDEINRRNTYATQFPQGQCFFLATNSHLGCMGVNGQRSPSCTLPIADKTRCGFGQGGDTRGECLPAAQEGNAQGGAVYNYLLGVPDYHPDYKGVFTQLSHVRDPKTLNLGGTTTNPGTTTPTNPTTPTTPVAPGACPASGNCVSSPNCCSGGSVCYEKDKFWASCLTPNSCVPGVHADDPPQYQTPWSCTRLGGSDGTNGNFAVLWKPHQDRALDIAGARNADGTNVWSWGNLGPGYAQMWQFTACGQIKWLYANKCLDVANGANRDGANLHIWTCSCTNTNQLFERVGELIRWKGSTRCVDVAGGSYKLGTNVQLWSCNPNNPNQQWVLQPLATSSAKTFAPLVVPSRATSITWGDKVLNDAGSITDFEIIPVGSQVTFKGSDGNVMEVCEEAFDKCDKGLCIAEETAANGGTTTHTGVFSFTTAERDSKFFISTNRTACEAGQKLQIISTASGISDAAEVAKANKDVTEDPAAKSSADFTTQALSAATSTGVSVSAVAFAVVCGLVSAM